MRHYFEEFSIGPFTYMPIWFELRRGKNFAKVQDDEGVKVFTAQGWMITRVGYSPVYAGRVNQNKERVMDFATFRSHRVWP